MSLMASARGGAATHGGEMGRELLHCGGHGEGVGVVVVLINRAHLRCRGCGGATNVVAVVAGGVMNDAKAGVALQWEVWVVVGL